MSEDIREFIRLSLTEDAYFRQTGSKYSAAKQLKELIDDSQVPLRFFTMTKLNKVGVNPKSEYGTPAGVYCYPLNTEHFNMLLHDNLPFAGDSPNCTVIELNDVNRALVVSGHTSVGTYTTATEVRSAIDRVIRDELPQADPDDSEIENIIDTVMKKNKHAAKNPQARLFGALYIIADRKPTVWTSMMRSLGIDVCIDMGAGVIHPNEPAQAVFLSPRAYRVINSFKTADILRKNIPVPTMSDIIDAEDSDIKDAAEKCSAWIKMPEVVSNSEMTRKIIDILDSQEMFYPSPWVVKKMLPQDIRYSINKLNASGYYNLITDIIKDKVVANKLKNA